MSLSLRLASACGVAAFFAAGPAFAQGSGPGGAAPLPERLGWELGGGLYGGEINCDNENGDFCDGVTEAGGFDLHANYFFKPELGITLDVWPMIHREDNWTFTHNIVTVGVKWRPAPIFTFTAGVGSAQARLSYRGLVNLDSESDTVGSVMFAGAVEVLRGKGFAVDLQARLGVGFYSEDNNENGEPDVVGRNVGFGAGATWF